MLKRRITVVQIFPLVRFKLNILTKKKPRTPRPRAHGYKSHKCIYKYTYMHANINKYS